MRRGQLLFVLWCSGIVSVTGSIGDVRCVSDFGQNISCVLNLSDDLKSNTYSLKFDEIKDTEGGVFCPLVMVNQSHSQCDCNVLETDDFFTSDYKYDIQLCGDTGCHVVMTGFRPKENIQLTPPPELNVQQTEEGVNISCRSEKYDDHYYLCDALIYQLNLQETQSSEKKIMDNISPDKPTWIGGSHLKPRAEYCIKARFKADESKHYGGIWSEWSKPMCWINPAEEDTEHEGLFILLAKSLVPACLSVGVLLLVLYSPAARMKIKTLSYTPSPAPFFQPMFQQREGNLQEWLAPGGKFLLTYKAEEDLITDIVTVVPATTKDPEESPVFHNPAGLQLTFPQTHPTSYVGLPGMHEASHPRTVLCAGNTSYTQLPCSVWEFDMSQVEAASSPPPDFLEISRADSGCSCKDLTQSPECSLPSSPVEENPPPRYCNDYCILNKTANGVVPVLVSKENKGKDPSRSQQSEELSAVALGRVSDENLTNIPAVFSI
ncbi:interleukin-21 receptor-like isoform 2-T2 [Odontesthes bonariensis]|uniref:interleukin-21 receptor-like n=1 Tax=Odontesthes bonariensis TaxID=219752 RepID=UPI003F58A43C